MELQYCFISTGEKIGFYTLRGMCNVKVIVGGKVFVVAKDYFFRNLSTDKAKAETLAEEFASYYGVPLRGNAEFELEEIKRQKAEEAQNRREQIEREVARREQEYREEYARISSEGVFVVGKYTGMTPEAVSKTDLGYLFWAAQQHSENAFSKFNINCEVAKRYIEENNVQRGGFVGEIGEEVQVELTYCSSRWTTGQFPTLMHKCVTDNQEVVTFFSVAKKFKELKAGDKFLVKGLVKDHYTSYNGDKSTTINKPKII